jgi:hypothetical protein
MVIFFVIILKWDREYYYYTNNYIESLG